MKVLMKRRWLVLATIVIVASAVAGGTCCRRTPGFWKNHTRAWEGLSPSDPVSSLFESAPAPFDNWSLLEALQGGGGDDIDGAIQIMLRAAVAAALNLEKCGCSMSYLQELVNDAIESGNRSEIIDLAAYLDDYNNGQAD